MKNLLFPVWFIFCYGLLSLNLIELRARSAGIPLESVEECMDRTNITSQELIKLRDSTEERIKLINGDGDFRRYGCFLACVLQLGGTMTGSALNAYKMIENIDRRHDSDLDANSFLHKTIQMCANTLEEINDECDVALAFKVCTLKAMRNDIQIK